MIFNVFMPMLSFFNIYKTDFSKLTQVGIYGAGNFGMITLLGAVAVPMYNAQAAILLEKARNGAASPKNSCLPLQKIQLSLQQFWVSVSIC